MKDKVQQQWEDEKKSWDNALCIMEEGKEKLECQLNEQIGEKEVLRSRLSKN